MAALIQLYSIYHYSIYTLSVNVEFGGQNWPNIKLAFKGFSGLFYVFYGIFMAFFAKCDILKMVIFKKKTNNV